MSSDGVRAGGSDDPGEPPALAARRLMQAGRWSQAVALLQRAIAVSDDGDLQFILGYCLHERGDDAGALAAFDAVIARAGPHPEALAARGAVLAQLGQDLRGIADLKAALALDPGHRRARRRLAELQARIGHWHQAEENLAIARAPAPDDPLMRFLHGSVLAALGRIEEAEAVLVQPLADPALEIERRQRLAEVLLLAGRAAEAGALLAPLQAADPNNARTWSVLGDLFLARGEGARALQCWRRAAGLQPNLTSAFTRLAHYGLKQAALLRLRGGSAPDLRQPVAAADLGVAARPAPRHPGRITVGLLGYQGRFGDQLALYAIARLYADRFGLALATAPWPGQMLYGIDDPPILRVLPAHVVSTDDDPVIAALRDPRPEAPPLVDRDLVARYSPRALAGSRDAVRRLYRPAPFWRARVQAIEAAVRSRGRTLVAAHIRRTDFKTEAPGKLVEPQAYRAWLDAAWPDLDAPVLYVASDDLAEVMPAFAGLPTMTAADLGDPFPEAPFFPDFHVLSIADIVMACDSGFSRWAALLNEKARSLVRPDAGGRTFRAYAPWED
ncbi:MAG: tetratricopeptide repeat protein [Alphaproteobacteria bacterium]|nr:tetratricopeptide repeat protein [Alphaproteobacteria bacterium]